MKNFQIVLCFMLFAFGVSGQVEVYSAAGTSQIDVCTGLISIIAKGDAGPFDIEVYSENPSGPDYLLKQDQLDGVAAVEITYTDLISQRYTVFITDVFGCVTTEEVEIFCGCDAFQWNDLQSGYSIVNPTSCDSGDGTISYYSQTGALTTGGLRPYTYTWDDGLSTGSFNRGGLSPGDYTLTVTDAYGCEISKIFTFVADDEPRIAASIKHPCEGLTNGSLSFTFLPSDPTNDIIYDWSILGGDIVTLNKYSFRIDNMPEGAACVQVTNDDTGCVYDYCYELVEIRSCGDFEIDEESIELVKSCPLQETGMAVVNAKGGNPNGAGFYPDFCNSETYDSYEWKRVGENDVLSTSKSLMFVPAGFYEIMITDRCGREVSTQVEIEEHPLISIPTPQIDRGCPGEGVITYSNIGGGAGPPYTAVWSNGQTGPQASGLSTGTYTVTITDGAGCEETRDVFLENYPAPEISFTDIMDPCFDVPALQSILLRQSYRDGSISSSVSWGTESFSVVKYEWILDGDIVSTSKDLVFDGMDFGFFQFVFTLRVEDSNGCEATAEVILINDIKYDRRVSDFDCSCELASLCNGITQSTHTSFDASGWKECGVAFDDCRRVECDCSYPSVVTDASLVPLTVNEPELVCSDIEEFKPYVEVERANCKTELFCPTFTQVDDNREGDTDGFKNRQNCKLLVTSVDPNPYDIGNPPTDNKVGITVVVPPLGGDVVLKVFMEKDLSEHNPTPVFQWGPTFLSEGEHQLEGTFLPTCIGRHILRAEFGEQQTDELLWFVQHSSVCMPDIEDADSEEGVSNTICLASSEVFEDGIVDCEFWTVNSIFPNPFVSTSAFQTYTINSTSSGSAKIRFVFGDGAVTDWKTFEIDLGLQDIQDPGSVYSLNDLPNAAIEVQIEFAGETQVFPIIALQRPAPPLLDPEGKAKELHESVIEDAITSVVASDVKALKIYPNPFTSVLTVNFGENRLLDNAKYSILGIDGRKVIEGAIQLSSSKSMQIDCAFLPQGVYVLKIESGSFTASKKIFKYD